MQESVRPVAVGFILGIICLIFGIFWAIYLVVGHDRIHKTLSESAMFASGPDICVSHYSRNDTHVRSLKAGHNHRDPTMPQVLLKREVPEMQTGKLTGQSQAQGVVCDNEASLMEEAHERLRRGHIHEMGLGILTIALSFVIAFLSAPDRVKTFASACIGVGSLVYPFAWIVMGYRTTAMGSSASADSVIPIVAGSVPLVLLGLFITMFYLIKGLFTRSRPQPPV